MKILFLFLLSINLIYSFTVEKYQEHLNQNDVINIIKDHDPNNYFMTIDRELSQRQQINFITNILNIRKEFLYVVKDKNDIIGIITFTKREEPSKEYANKLKLQGSYYSNYVEMMLSQENLPEHSEYSVLRISLLLKENYRNKGYGKKLMTYAKALAEQDKEIIAITLDTYDTNIIAIKLYESLGYVKVCHNKKLKQISYRLNIKSEGNSEGLKSLLTCNPLTS